MDRNDRMTPGAKPGTGRGAIRRFAGDERGTIAILWAMMLVVVLGFVALIFDIGRMGILQSDLQGVADNAALAAAGELDGRDDSITRANRAAADLIGDRSTFADNPLAGDQVAFQVFYYTALPASDLTPMDPGTRTTDPLQAAFAEVVVTPRRITLQFASALAGLLGQQGLVQPFVRATAVAGRSMEACDVSPMMFCLPSADYGTDEQAVIGKQLLLRMRGQQENNNAGGGGGNAGGGGGNSGGGGGNSGGGGNDAQWGPGDFGFVSLSVADTGGTCAGQGGNLERCQVAAEITISQCYNQRGVDLRPGQATGIREFMNVRFDHYSHPNLSATNSIYPAAPNVIQAGPRQCSNQGNSPNVETPDMVSLPRDTFTFNDRIGDGDFVLTNYMAINHGGTGAHLDVYNRPDIVPPGLEATRYAVYLKEIAWSADPERETSEGAVVTPENMRPQCAANNVSDTPDRRVIIAAGIDCIANNIRGAATDVPVERFFRVFLTEPIGTGGNSDANVYGEVIGVEALNGYTSAGTGGIFRDVIQLYR